jgi:hypothetical protein
MYLRFTARTWDEAGVTIRHPGKEPYPWLCVKKWTVVLQSIASALYDFKHYIITLFHVSVNGLMFPSQK